MKRQLLTLLIATVATLQPVIGQDKKVGGPCEGCEAIHESPVPFEQLTMLAKLPDATWAGKKRNICLGRNIPNYPAAQ